MAVSTLDLVALAVWIGAANFRLWLVPRASTPAEQAAIDASLARLAGACFLVLIVTSLLLLALRVAVMSGEPMLRALPMTPEVILHTHYGPVWSIRPAALLLLLIGWIAARRSTSGTAAWTLIATAGAIFAISRSASGHAADAGDFSLDELMDWLHLMAISTWVGGVFVALWVVFPVLPRWVEVEPRRAAEFARRFSHSSAIALGVVVVTGVYAAVMRLASVASLVDTDYGRTLSLKLVLVASTVVLGAINRNVYVKRLAQAPRRSSVSDVGRGGASLSITFFARNVALEAALMLATLIAVSSMLQEMPPKMTTHHEHALHPTLP